MALAFSPDGHRNGHREAHQSRTAGNVARYTKLAETLRRLYFEDICENLAKAQVLNKHELSSGVLRMHVHEVFKQRETLTGIITTNHDGLLQAAWQEVGTEVNLGIPFTSADVSQSVNGKPPVIHLHGSFTWEFWFAAQCAVAYLLIHVFPRHCLDSSHDSERVKELSIQQACWTCL